MQKRHNMKKLYVTVVLLVVAFIWQTFVPPPGHAGPCRSSYWLPTFVHDLRPGYYPGPYYVNPNKTFTLLKNINGSYVQNACELIQRFGIRDQQGFTDCQNYTRIQCGCDTQSYSNPVCSAFLKNHDRMTSSGTAQLLSAQSSRDLVGASEDLRGNNIYDAAFRVKLNAPNRVVEAIEVRNLDGIYSVWDTIPSNISWLCAVSAGGRIMNRQDGSINFRLGSNTTTLNLYCEDNDSISGGKTRFKITVFFQQGDPLVMNVQP